MMMTVTLTGKTIELRIRCNGVLRATVVPLDRSHLFSSQLGTKYDFLSPLEFQIMQLEEEYQKWI